MVTVIEDTAGQDDHRRAPRARSARGAAAGFSHGCVGAARNGEERLGRQIARPGSGQRVPISS